MGIDTGHLHNDDSIGIGIGNFANEATAMYVSHGDQLHFSDDAIAEGIGSSSRLPLKFGLFFFDYDLDGWLDLLTANGHLEQENPSSRRARNTCSRHSSIGTAE